MVQSSKNLSITKIASSTLKPITLISELTFFALETELYEVVDLFLVLSDLLIFSKNFILTLSFILPTWTWTSFDLDTLETIIPFCPKVETNTSVLGFASSIEIVEFGVFGKFPYDDVTEISLIDLFNLFLKLFKLRLELASSFIFEIISVASSFASNNIFLAWILALLIISCSCSIIFELSLTRDFFSSETSANFLEISNFSFSILDLLS